MKKRLAAALKSFVFALVDLGGRRPYLVIATAIMMMGACWTYASNLQIRSDIMELLPRDSPGFQAFERRLERVGGRATIVVLAESPDRKANERFIDAMRARLDGSADLRPMILSIESGTKDVRSYFEANKWLFADLKDLEEADNKLERQIAIKSGMVEDLLDEGAAEHALGMDDFEKKFEAKAKEKDSFPTGYFASADGTRIAMRIFTTTSGMGGGSDEKLYARVRAMASETRAEIREPGMTVGYGGDIPNAQAEKDALLHEAVWATVAAAILILAGVVWFYGSPWSLILIGFPPLFGVGCAYAFATWKYGYVNASGAFLGAIILGNGVNYPIVLYSRYKEFRARGMTCEVARREAVWNAFRAELVGSSVASIAYGSLTVTRFRGFSQFGVIGFVGMLLVWISMIPCLPALIVIVERIQARLPAALAFLREKPAHLAKDESRGPVARFVGDFTARHPRWFVLASLGVILVSCWRLPSFLHDPWEYNFDKLGSEGARKGGAFEISKKADAIFNGKMNLSGSLVLADSVEHVEMIEQRILANDARDPEGPLIEGVTTAQDFLPKEQTAKLAVLDRLRERLTPRVMASLSEEERTKLEKLKPPETLRTLGLDDLPPLLKSRFSEKDGTVGTVFYVRYRPEVNRNDGHNLLRMSATIDGIVLPDGTRVDTASRATVFAEMIRSLERDGPLATGVAFLAVAFVVVFATSSWRGAGAVLLSLVVGVAIMLGLATHWGERLNFLNFIALPITFGIGSEYPFNIFDRSRLLGGDVTRAVKLHLGAVMLCSFTTLVGYGSLLFADNQAMRSFGRLAITGEATCLLVAALFLPSLLHLIGCHTVGKKQMEPPSSASAVLATKEAE